MMARWLGQIISKMARLMGWLWWAMVSTYWKWFEEGKTTKQQQCAGQPQLINTRCEWGPSELVWTNRRAILAQVGDGFNAGDESNVSWHTMHWTLLNMGLYRHGPLWVPMLTPVHHRQPLHYGHVITGPGTWTSGKSPGLINPFFCYTIWMTEYLCRLPGKVLVPGWTTEQNQACAGGGSVMFWVMFCLGNPGSGNLCGSYSYALQWCPGRWYMNTFLHGNSILQWCCLLPAG